jgi:hypothetical protein
MTEKQIKLIARSAYPDYKGRKIRFSVQKYPIDCNYNANWCEGSRTQYKFFNLVTSKVMSVPDFAPWTRPEEMVIDFLPENCICITHNISCGYDAGLFVYFPKTLQIEAK